MGRIPALGGVIDVSPLFLGIIEGKVDEFIRGFSNVVEYAFRVACTIVSDLYHVSVLIVFVGVGVLVVKGVENVLGDHLILVVVCGFSETAILTFFREEDLNKSALFVVTVIANGVDLAVFFGPGRL